MVHPSLFRGNPPSRIMRLPQSWWLPTLIYFASCANHRSMYYTDAFRVIIASLRTNNLVTSSTSPHRSPRRRQYLHSSITTNDEDGNGDDVESPPQRGMEEAFALLQTLASKDLNEQHYSSNITKNDDKVGGDWYSSGDIREKVRSKLKYSRTDDTPASNYGKCTVDEIEHYLEMQMEMETTATTTTPLIIERDGTFSNIDDDDTEKIDISNEDEGEEASNIDYPWKSINPILRLRGPVASGYGRGGKQLGVPTANLPTSLFQSALEDIPNGVYFGWAVIEQKQIQDGDVSVLKTGRNKPIKAVVNVGYSPTFEGKENKERIVEAHLITSNSPMTKPPERIDYEEHTIGDDDSNCTANEIDGDFYNELMRLQLIGYLRPEQKFNSFPDLIAQIHRDIGNADWALDSMPFVFSKEDEFIKNAGTIKDDWIGSGGGNGSASWEYESW